jgi:probable O-glycosylation ligase (exosortase A-associated)
MMWDRTAKSLVFVLITTALTTNRVRLHGLLWIMAIALGYYGLKGGVFSVLSGGIYRAYGPIDSAIENNNDLAAGLVVALPIMNYMRSISAPQLTRLGWSAVILFSIVCVATTYSRGGFLGLVAVGAFLWLTGQKKLTTGLLIAGAVFVLAILMPQQYGSRIGSIESYSQDASALGRIEIWGVAAKVALARPLTGGGFKATESQPIVDRFQPGAVARAVHNVFLGVAAEQGFPGLVVWSALLFLGWRNSRWLAKCVKGERDLEWVHELGRTLQAAIVGYCVVGFFGNYAYWDYYFTLIGLAAAARTIVERRNIPEQPRIRSRISTVRLGGMPAGQPICGRKTGKGA